MYADLAVSTVTLTLKKILKQDVSGKSGILNVTLTRNNVMK